jgi:hypothetical protein
VLLLVDEAVIGLIRHPVLWVAQFQEGIERQVATVIAIADAVVPLPSQSTEGGRADLVVVHQPSGERLH